MAALTPSSPSFRDVFTKHPEPCLIVNSETLGLVAANTRALEVTGLQPGAVLTRILPELLQTWDVKKFQAALNLGDFQSPELRGVTVFSSSGKASQVDLLVSRLRFGGVDSFLVVLSDASARIVLEEQLRQAQKMETVGMLAGGIAHDFNNLLTIISGYAHMLLTDAGNHAGNRASAEQVIKASDRASALTHQLLSFSRRQVLQSKVLDLNSLLQGMSPMLRRLIGEHIDLRISPGGDLDRVHFDPGQIEQVIMNLAVNARDAMGQGGLLTIETRNLELGETYRTKHPEVREGHYVMLAVTDSGVGMDAGTRAKVFEPFFTTKEQGQGTGLGLSMVLGIVKRAGGTIDVYSELGRGTTVKVFFPRADSAEIVPLAAPRSETSEGWETVLLVEDEEAVRNLVRAALQMKGYKVVVAANGKEALAEAKKLEGPLHLLITDLVLPGMHGRDVARTLHRTRPEMRVLFMSGYTDTALHASGELGRSLHFLGKPFTPAALAAKVRAVLDEAGKALPQRSTHQKGRAGS